MTSRETETIQFLIKEFSKITSLIPSPLKTVAGTSQLPLNVTKIGTETDKLLDLLASNWFVSVAGYFINHRTNSPYAHIDNEYKVQDLIFCVASSIMPDLQFEDPQKKNIGALSYTRIDFFSSNNDLFLEIKFANSKHSAKKIEDEISEDIVKYGKQLTFNTLIFFIYCDNYLFPNQNDFEKSFTGLQTIQTHQFNTYCIIKP